MQSKLKSMKLVSDLIDLIIKSWLIGIPYFLINGFITSNNKLIFEKIALL